MAREPNAKAIGSKSYVPSHLSPVRRETKLGGDGRKVERSLHADCGRRRAKSVRQKPSPRAMRSANCTRRNERNGVRPKEAEPPFRVLGGYITPTGGISTQALNDGVIAFDFPTETYWGTAVESP